MALTLKKAVECIEKGIAKAQELGFNVTIAVVDEAGHLVAAHRMDGAFWVTWRPSPRISSCSAKAAFPSWRTAASSAPSG